ncbi:lipopolysaccharide biosynthesis protein [Marinigracilibium pacificum]|uniref:Lipopolysaccharide biosynthesis protein n=1 Tax=Marinigracilibium pacificum TaxID=2729599 RepID=A0A848J4F9_9BACT|nr:lipopolysaccharide biosynthesis protein [Marinigracilibium pacificum]NMM48052.1 lipopolysaccharide biosynthesis protein [Marinigracilibium pacificum]
MKSIKGRTTFAFLWDFFGTVLNQGSSFIISIFLARLLSPADFGLVGMSLVFITISQVFVDVGLSSALIQNKSNSNLTYNSVFYFNVSAGIILTLVFYVISPLIADFYNNEEIENLVKWLSLIFISNSFGQVQIAILKRDLNFKALTLRLLIANIIGGALGVISAFYGFGVYSLVIQQLTVAIISTILLWYYSEWKPGIEFSYNEIRKLSSFSLFVFFDRFISSLFLRLDVLIIGKVFSANMLGFYSRASSLRDQVTKYSSSSLTKVFFPVLSNLQDNKNAYEEIYFKVLSIISFLSYLITGVLFFLGPDIIIFLFGEKWIPSIGIFQILVLAICNRPLNAMMVNAYLSKGKSGMNFKIGLLRKVFQLIPLSIAVFYGLNEFLVGYVLVSYLIILLNIYFVNVNLGLSAKIHLRKIFEGIGPLIIFILLFNYFQFEFFWQRVLYTFFFILVYIIFNMIINNDGLKYIKYNFVQVILKKLV